MILKSLHMHYYRILCVVIYCFIGGDVIMLTEKFQRTISIILH